MKPVNRFLAALALVAVGATTASAALVTTYTLNRLFGAADTTGTHITDVMGDGVNRVWFATNRLGVTALSNTVVAKGFPLFSTLTDAGFTTSLTSVAFGPVGPTTDKKENFFLGSNTFTNSGVLYGRMLDTGATFANNRLIKESLETAFGTSKINAIKADGESKLWLATDLGVTSVSLPDLTLSTKFYAPDQNLADTNVVHLVDANPTTTGGEAFFATTAELYMIKTNSVNGWLHFTSTANLNGIGGIAVDASGDLWVAEATGLTKTRRILRFGAAGLSAWFNGTTGEPSPAIYLFDPGDLSSDLTHNDERTINTIKVSPSTGEVWLGTTRGAYFQKPDVNDQLAPYLCGRGVLNDSTLDDVDGQGQTCAPNGSGWRPMPQNNSEQFDAYRESFRGIFLDALGNAWLGSDNAIRGVIIRNLTLSQTRYVGTSQRALVRLIDEKITDPSSVVVKVKVEGVEATIPMTQDTPGQFSASFGFTTSAAADPTVGAHLFKVDKTKENAIEAIYEYTDDLNVKHPISLKASWVEIAKFEDDLWIGGGPCFIRTIGN